MSISICACLCSIYAHCMYNVCINMTVQCVCLNMCVLCISEYVEVCTYKCLYVLYYMYCVVYLCVHVLYLLLVYCCLFITFSHYLSI